MSWWYLIPAILIVVLWAGWYIAAFVKDKNRSDSVEDTQERIAPQPGMDMNHSPDEDR